MTAILLNGEPAEIAPGQSIQDLVESLRLPAERLAVEHNLKIVKREHWRQQRLEEGDKLEIVQFVGGGSVETS